jgi:hypothetical protein
MVKNPNILFLVSDHPRYYEDKKIVDGSKIQKQNSERVSDNRIEFIQTYTVFPLFNYKKIFFTKSYGGKLS